MRQNEILERLKNGEVISRSTSFNFKYGKLERGTSYAYTIGEETIRENQFEAIRDLIVKDNEASTSSIVKYKLRVS